MPAVHFIVGSDQLIDGINEGVQYMHEGGKAQLIIPFKLAYYVPGLEDNNYSTYFFEIEINEIIDTPQTWEMRRINEYLVENNYEATPDTTGFCYIEIVEGTGDSIKENDAVEIEFECWSLYGDLLTATENNETYKIILDYNYLIFNRDTVLNRGFIKGLTQMKEFGESVIIIPYSMGYGSNYLYTGSVPPYITFIFNIFSIKKYE